MTNLEKLQNLLGLQGGTIHQMVGITGLSVSQIIDLDVLPYEYSKKNVSGKNKGSVASTCSPVWLLDNLVKDFQGNISFWKSALKSVDMKQQGLI